LSTRPWSAVKAVVLALEGEVLNVHLIVMGIERMPPLFAFAGAYLKSCGSGMLYPSDSGVMLPGWSWCEVRYGNHNLDLLAWVELLGELDVFAPSALEAGLLGEVVTSIQAFYVFGSSTPALAVALVLEFVEKTVVVHAVELDTAVADQGFGGLLASTCDMRASFSRFGDVQFGRWGLAVSLLAHHLALQAFAKVAEVLAKPFTMPAGRLARFTISTRMIWVSRSSGGVSSGESSVYASSILGLVRVFGILGQLVPGRLGPGRRSLSRKGLLTLHKLGVDGSIGADCQCE